MDDREPANAAPLIRELLNELTNDHKIALIGQMPEIKTALKILTAAYEDMQLKEFISFDIEFDNERLKGRKFQLRFSEVIPPKN